MNKNVEIQDLMEMVTAWVELNEGTVHAEVMQRMLDAKTKLIAARSLYNLTKNVQKTTIIDFKAAKINKSNMSNQKDKTR